MKLWVILHNYTLLQLQNYILTSELQTQLHITQYCVIDTQLHEKLECN